MHPEFTPPGDFHFYFTPKEMDTRSGKGAGTYGMTIKREALRQEILTGYNAYMRQHFAKVQMEFLATQSPTLVLDAAKAGAALHSAQLHMRTALFGITWVDINLTLHKIIDTQPTIDRMVREAKSRLAVSIEANTSYELIQMNKSLASTLRVRSVATGSLLERMRGAPNSGKWTLSVWSKGRPATTQNIPDGLIKLGHSFDEMAQGFKRASEASAGFTDYANALKTLRQKQREVRELSEEITMHKMNLNSTFGKMGARQPLEQPIACTADALAEGLPPL